MVQTLEEFNIAIGDVLGCGLTEVIAAYIDGVLHLDQCLCIAECVGKYVEKFAAESSKFIIMKSLKIVISDYVRPGLTEVKAANDDLHFPD